MDIKLDPTIEDIINQTYSIDSSVLKEINQRRQVADSAKSSFNSTLSGTPGLIEEPVESDSVIENVENDLDYKFKLKEKELESTLDQLAKIDIKIDGIDIIIEDLDRQANVLIDEINVEIDNVKKSYEDRVASDCVSDLAWKYLGESYSYNIIAGGPTLLYEYKVIKDPEQEIAINYYGIKYYQKPSNRDYGFSVISDFEGTISIGSSTLAVITANAIDNIQIGDQIADSVDNPQAFNAGEFPSIIGIGSTSVLGITSSVYGSVSLGSSVIAITGIGTTTDFLIGNYIINENIFTSDTQVVGFGTTTVTITYNDLDTSSNITTQIIVPSVLVNTSSIGIATDVEIGIGTYLNYPSLNLSIPSSLNLQNSNFTVIRTTEDITVDFDYTKSPLDPVKIGIANSSRLGLGHSSILVNNGESSKSVNWREVLGRPEPKVGNDKAVFYEGAVRWPCFITETLFTPYSTYAQEGKVYKFADQLSATYTNVSPNPGVNPNGPVCNEYGQKIIEAQSKLNEVEQRNLPRIQQLVLAGNSLRKTRDSYELKAWGYLQSASYIRMEMNEITTQLNSIRSVNYDSLQSS